MNPVIAITVDVANLNTTTIAADLETVGSSPLIESLTALAIPASAATSDSLGTVQLTGDLGGTAESPTVPGLAGLTASLASKASVASLTAETMRAEAAEGLLATDSSVVHLAGTETITGAKTFDAGTLLDKGSQVFDIRAYVTTLNSSTDNTVGLNACIADAMAVGGSVFISGYCRADGAVVIPYTGPSGAPVQTPLRIFGTGPTFNGAWPSSPINGGSILDLRYAGGDGIHVAKIDTRGAGTLEIDHLTIKSGGTDNYQIMQTTNTTVFIHDNGVVGNSSNSGTSCAQDFLRCGGSTNSIGNGANAPFQGYGSKMRDNFYSNIRCGTIFGTYCNAIEVENETFSTTCGSSYAQGAPYLFAPMAGNGASGCKIKGGTIEVTNYAYGVAVMNDSQANIFDNIGLYDDNGTTLAGIYFGTSNTSYNTILGGLLNPSLPWAAGPSALNQTIIDPRTGNLSQFPMGVSISSLTFANGIGATRQALINNGGRIWTSTTPDALTGGPMKIDTGSGGSYFDEVAYSMRFYDQTNALRAEIMPGKAAGAIRVGSGATGARPSASTAGAGAIWYDTTINDIVVSDGTNWNPVGVDSSVVHLSGVETITGEKTFTGNNPSVRFQAATPGASFKSTQSGTQEWRLASGYNSATSISLVDITNSNQVLIVENSNNTISIADAYNISLSGSTGTKFGTSASQKLAYYGATPIVQPLAATDLGVVLANLGLRAAGTAYPITTSGTVTLSGASNALGTPLSIVLTNATGTAAGLTAGNVTTNANLTGPITSSGNATSIASQTGTGTKFVMDTSPTIKTPTFSGGSISLTGGAQQISNDSSYLYFLAATDFYLRSNAGNGVHINDNNAGTVDLALGGGAVGIGGTITLSDAKNLVLGTTTGTKIGTATTQKLAFYNSTPIVQPTGSALTALSSLGLVASPTIAESDVTGLAASLALLAPLASPTFTGVATAPLSVQTPQAITVTANAGTADVLHGIQTFTNSSAATMAITLAVTSAVDGQTKIVRIYDFSAVVETIGWTNTENSNNSVPIVSNGSTTLPLSVGFIFNGSTSKWRCIGWS